MYTNSTTVLFCCSISDAGLNLADQIRSRISLPTQHSAADEQPNWTSHQTSQPPVHTATHALRQAVYEPHRRASALAAAAQTPSSLRICSTGLGLPTGPEPGVVGPAYGSFLNMGA